MKILTDKRIDEMLALGKQTVVSISVSGGKDSDTLALDLNEYLDALRFTGERILIHSDLGAIEHADSLPTCRRLAKHLELPLIAVKPKRPMVERWEYRWECNVERFINLRSVKIATWASSSIWRFCTSEEKTAPICRKLKELYPGRFILNAVGIRGEESANRAKKPITSNNPLLTSKRTETTGITWFPIRDYRLEDVFLSHRRHGFTKHEAYEKNGNTRVSCVFCVLAGEQDLRASLKDERTHQVYRRLAELEAATTFGFQAERWLSDLAPHLLPKELRERLQRAKEKAIERRLADKLIPPELLFNPKTGFPAFQPSLAQAAELATARLKVGDLLGLPMKYVTPRRVFDRYAELLAEKRQKNLQAGKKSVVKERQPTLF